MKLKGSVVTMAALAVVGTVTGALVAYAGTSSTPGATSTVPVVTAPVVSTSEPAPSVGVVEVSESPSASPVATLAPPTIPDGLPVLAPATPSAGERQVDPESGKTLPTIPDNLPAPPDPASLPQPSPGS